MKKKQIKKTAIVAVILSFICSLSCSSAFYVQAGNGENVLRVITNDTPFYQDAEKTNLLFYLPYSYYVKALSVENGMTHAEIGCDLHVKLDGYIPTELLLDEKKDVENPYPYVTITSAKNTTLYEDSELTRPIFYIFSGRSMIYYGNGTNNKEPSYYVSFNGNLGYVRETDLMPFSIPNHPNPLFLEEEQPPAQKASETNNVTVLRILIIATLSLAGIIGLAFSLRKKPINTVASTYNNEENDE